MAFRDYSTTFSPVTNQFAGLGAGIGAGANQLVKNRLYDQMRKRFLEAKSPEVKTRALSELGLSQAPVQGDPQYDIFNNLVNARMARMQSRADIGRQAMTLDEQGGLDYMLAEPKASGSGKGSSGAEGLDLAGQAAAQELAKAANQVLETGNILSQQYSVESQNAFNQANQRLNTARVNFQTVTGMKPEEVLPSQSQIMTTVKAALDMQNNQANIAGKQLNAAKDVKAVVTEMSTKLNGVVNKVRDMVNSYKTDAPRITNLVQQFKANPESPQVMAAAAKQLGLAIEPGLQVTSEEVNLFSGNNWLTPLLEALPTVGRAVKGFTTADTKSLEKAAADAGKANPYVTWRMIQLAAETMQASGQAGVEVVNGMIDQGAGQAIAESDVVANAAGNLISPQVKQQLISQADAGFKTRLGGKMQFNVDFPPELSSSNPPLSSSELANWDPNGPPTDTSQAGDLSKQKAATGSSTEEPSTKDANLAGETAGDVVDALLDNLLAE